MPEDTRSSKNGSGDNRRCSDRGSPMEEILNPDYEDFDQTAKWQRAVVESYTLISVLTKKG